MKAKQPRTLKLNVQLEDGDGKEVLLNEALASAVEKMFRRTWPDNVDAIAVCLRRVAAAFERRAQRYKPEP
jgi:hypothetical protein